MNRWIDIKDWKQEPDKHLIGTRYVSDTGKWVEIGNNATIGNYATIGNGVTIGNDSTIGNGVTIGNDATIGNGAKIGNYATIGNDVTIGNYATIGDGVTIGNAATIDRGATIDSSPSYIQPPGGPWPLGVSDPGKRLVFVGCEVHSIDFWLGGGADKVREKYGCPETAQIYDRALVYIAEAMGWR